MSTNIIIEPELKTLLKRLKLSKLLDTLPERLASARAQKTPHQDFLMLLLSDEVSRRDASAVTLRAQRAHIDPDARFERWDDTAAVDCDKELLNELLSLRCASSRLGSMWRSWVQSAWARLFSLKHSGTLHVGEAIP